MLTKNWKAKNMDQSGFSASPWAAMLGHHSIGSNEHPGFVAHAHNAAVVHHHAHHNIPMDLHVAQGFPYYRYVFNTSNTYNSLHLYHLQCKESLHSYCCFRKSKKKNNVSSSINRWISIRLINRIIIFCFIPKILVTHMWITEKWIEFHLAN